MKSFRILVPLLSAVLAIIVLPGMQAAKKQKTG